MSVPELFIRRPVMTTLVMSGILLFGAIGYRSLSVSDLPNVDYPTILVQATLPGASPETMASAVATPLEKQFTTIAGVDSMTSVSALGLTQITIQFSLSRNIDAAGQDVQAAMGKAAKQLPANMPTPPTYNKVNPADQPVLYLAMTSDTLPLSTVDDYGENLLAQRLSMVNGVAQVFTYGPQTYAVRVQLDPNAMASRGLGIDEVEAAVEKGNVNLPTGTLYGKNQAFIVQASGQLMKAAEYRPMIVAYRQGKPVRLEEIGRVIDGVQNDKIASWFCGKPDPEKPEAPKRGIVLAVQRQPGANTVEVVDEIKKILPTFRAQMPPAISLDILYDRSESIRESVHDVQFTLVLTVVLVILVIFLFLRNVRATVIPSLALPLSIVGTFAAMYLLGYSLDNLSLMALTLSVGFVVDDAIVMLENIVRHMEAGEAPLAAALKGSREIGFTIISMTLSLAAVFIPVLFMSGILGRLLHEFAVTIMFAIVVSGFVSLSLTPMLCSRFVKAHAHEQHGKAFAVTQRFFDGMLALYDRTLQFVLRHRALIIVVSGFVLLATLYLFVAVPKGFFPSQDNNQAFAIVEGNQDISFDSLREHQIALMKIAAEDTNVIGFMSSVGAGGSTVSANQGRIFMHLRPRSEREHVDQVIQQLRKKFAEIPGISTYLQNPPMIRIGGFLTKSLYQFTLQGPDLQELYHWAPIVKDKMATLDGFQDVTTDLLITSPQVVLDIDRDKAQSLGVTADQIENALYDAYGQRQVSTIYAPVNQYWVIMELLPEYQRDPEAMGDLYIRSTTTGQLVPLRSVAKISRGVGPLTVNHLGQLPAVTISFNLVPGMSLGTAVDSVNKSLAELHLPATLTYGFQGSAQVFQSSMAGMFVLLIMSVVVIYIILGVLYESFIHPITILSGLPSAGLGALLTLKLFHLELDVYAFVGLIMLVGIVKKNAIMMVDFAIEAQREGRTAFDAIYQGCLLRFRPIMMTTMAALMGTLPIALGLGAGGEARRPLGLAVVGGLIVSQCLTLYLTPVVYLYLEAFQSWVRKGKKAPHAVLEPQLPLPVAK